MKTMQQWFSEYSISHQNKTNKKIHYICVPAIFFSIVGLLISIPSSIIGDITNLNIPIIENWAVVVGIFLLIFYIRLSFKVFLKMLFFTILCIVGNYYLGTIVPIFYASLLIFIIAWIGQFYGHKLEGVKPSFLKDLQFLLIGPAWVFDNIFKF